MDLVRSVTILFAGHVLLLNKLKKQIHYNTGPRQYRRGFLFVYCFFKNMAVAKSMTPKKSTND